MKDLQGFYHDLGKDRSQRWFGDGQLFLGIPYAKAPLGERRFTVSKLSVSSSFLQTQLSRRIESFWCFALFQFPEDIDQYNDRGEVHNATYYR